MSASAYLPLYHDYFRLRMIRLGNLRRCTFTKFRSPGESSAAMDFETSHRRRLLFECTDSRSPLSTPASQDRIMYFEPHGK